MRKHLTFPSWCFLENPMVQGDVEPQQPPHFTLRQGGHRKVRKSCHPTIGEAIQRRHAPREFFCPTTKKKDRSLQVGFIWHLDTFPLPPPQKKKKTLQEYMNIILGDFFDWILFDKNTDGYPQKKELDLREKSLGVENWLRETKTTEIMVILLWPDIPKPWALAFSFYFPPVYWGKKKRRRKRQLPQTNNLKTTRTSLSSDSESRSSPFTANVVKGFPGRFCCPQTFWTSSHVKWPSLVAGRLARSRMFLKRVQKVGCWRVKSMEQHNDWIEKLLSIYIWVEHITKLGKSNQKIDDFSFCISILYPFVTFDGWGCFHFAANRVALPVTQTPKTRDQVATRGTLIIGGIRHCLIAVPSGGSWGYSPQKVGYFCFHS